MNYLKRKLLGHVLMCGEGGGGGGGGGPEPGQAAGAVNEAAFGGASGGGGSGLTSAQTDQALSNFDAQQAGGKVSNADLVAAGGTPRAIDFSAPTVGGIVANATGSPTMGSLGNMATSLSPLGPVNAAAGLVNLGIGAINELSAANQPSAMNGPALVGNNGVGAAQGIAEGGFNNQTGVGGVPTSNSGAAVAAGSGGQADPAPSPAPGIVGSVAAPVAAPPSVAAPEVNYGLFGSLGMGGWTSAARKFAARKGVTTV